MPHLSHDAAATAQFRAYLAGYLESASSLLCAVQGDLDATPESQSAITDLTTARALIDRVALLVFPAQASSCAVQH